MKPFQIDSTNKIGTGFQVPEGYFETFSQEIVSKTLQKEPKIISISSFKYKWMGIAASITIILSLFSVFYFSNNKPVDAATLENYITMESTINQYDLIVGLELEEIKNITINSPIEDSTTEELFENDELYNSIIENL